MAGTTDRDFESFSSVGNDGWEADFHSYWMGKQTSDNYRQTGDFYRDWEATSSSLSQGNDSNDFAPVLMVNPLPELFPDDPLEPIVVQSANNITEHAPTSNNTGIAVAAADPHSSDNWIDITMAGTTDGDFEVNNMEDLIENRAIEQITGNKVS